MLIHRWPLTQGPYDAAGGLHLTNNGTVTFDGRGASFNGSSQWLSGTKTFPSSFTMSVWCTPVDFSARRSVMAVSDAGTSANSAGWCDDGNYTGMIVSCTSYVTITGELNVTNYPTDRFTLSTLTYDRASLRCMMWRNTIPIGTFAVTAAVSSTAFSIGRFGAYAGCYWYGLLADARIYDHALSADEIVRLHHLGPNGTGLDVPGMVTAVPNAAALGTPLGAGDR